MAFNGSGTFNRVHDWATDATNNIKISSSRMDAEDDGFATGLTNCICKDGQSTTTASIPFASGLSVGANIDLDSNTFDNAPAGMQHVLDRSLVGAYLNSDQLNVTGDGTAVTVPFDTEEFDYGSDFASNTFTAPADGVYRFDATVYLGNLGVGHTSGSVNFVNSGTPDPVGWVGSPYAVADSSGNAVISVKAVLSLTAAETIHLTATVSGSTKTVHIIGSNTNNTRFSAERIY